MPYNGGKTVRFPAAGTYTMECTVALTGGETFTVVNSLKCFEVMPKTEFTVVADIANSYKTGDVISVPCGTATNLLSTDKTGAVEVICYLTRNGEIEKVFDGAGESSFRLIKEGDYILSYIYQNPYGVVNSVNYSFDVEAWLGIEPAFIPVTFTSERNNTIADCMVTNYIDDVPNDALYRAAYIGDDRIFLAKGEQLLSGSYSFNKKLTNQKVVLSYRAGFNSDCLDYAKEYEIPVIKAGVASDYLVVYKANGEITREGVESAFSQSDVSFIATEDFGIKLPQRIFADDLNFSFGGKDGKADYEKMNVLSQIVY